MKPTHPNMTARELRRAQARAARKRPTRPRSNRLHSLNSTGGMLAIDRSRSYNPERAAHHSNTARMSWYRMSNGTGTINDFDNLATAINLCGQIALDLGDEATPIARAAQDAMETIQQRYQRTQRLGVDAQALRDIPPALDFYDELLSVASPNQMVSALDKVNAAIELRIREQQQAEVNKV